MSDVTRILAKIESGDPSAAEQLLPLVYEELRQLAAAKLAQEKPGQTLQATALVHEAYVETRRRRAAKHWNSAWPLFAAAAEAMRRILVDNARRRKREKRGGHLVRQELQPHEIAAPEIKHDLLALDEVLNELAKENPDQYDLVRLRFLAGLTIQQAAGVLGISTSTADRRWAYARAWLYRHCQGESDAGE